MVLLADRSGKRREGLDRFPLSKASAVQVCRINLLEWRGLSCGSFFFGCPLEDLTAGIYPHLARKNVEELVFLRVDMGRWFCASSHFTDNEVKRPVIIRGPRHLTRKNALVPSRIA